MTKQRPTASELRVARAAVSLSHSALVDANEALRKAEESWHAACVRLDELECADGVREDK